MLAVGWVSFEFAQRRADTSTGGAPIGAGKSNLVAPMLGLLAPPGRPRCRSSAKRLGLRWAAAPFPCALRSPYVPQALSLQGQFPRSSVAESWFWFDPPSNAALAGGERRRQGCDSCTGCVRGCGESGRSRAQRAVRRATQPGCWAVPSVGWRLFVGCWVLTGRPEGRLGWQPSAAAQFQARLLLGFVVQEGLDCPWLCPTISGTMVRPAANQGYVS